jgi:hypothetical protein
VGIVLPERGGEGFRELTKGFLVLPGLSLYENHAGLNDEAK